MKKLFASLMIAMTLTMTPSSKSHAAVGAVISVPTLMVVGGISALAGGVLFVDAASERPNFCRKDWFGCMGNGLLGIFILAPVGLIVLEGENNSLSFSEASEEMSHLRGFSSEAIAQYNSELDLLNAINAEITEEVVVNKKVDTKARWEEMSSHLSPATLKVAGATAANLLSNL